MWAKLYFDPGQSPSVDTPQTGDHGGTWSSNYRSTRHCWRYRFITDGCRLKSDLLQNCKCDLVNGAQKLVDKPLVGTLAASLLEFWRRACGRKNMDAFTESLRALISERERVNREGQDILIGTLDLTKVLHEEIEAAHERYRQGLMALSSRGASPATPLQSVNGATVGLRPRWLEQAKAQIAEESQDTAPIQFPEFPSDMPRNLQQASGLVRAEGGHEEISQTAGHFVESEPRAHNGWNRWSNWQHAYFS
jgi:hypothetical protein